LAVRPDPYEEAKRQLRLTVSVLGLSEEVYESLVTPERSYRSRYRS